MDESDKTFDALKAKLAAFDMSTLPFCCDFLKGHLSHKCKQHGNDCPDHMITIGVGGGWKNPHVLWFGHSPNATYFVKFCPWCAAELPPLDMI